MMGANSPQPFFVSLDLEDMTLKNEKKCKSNGSLLSKALAADQAKIRWLGRKRVIRINGGHVNRSKRPTRILMKRRARLEGSRRPANGIQRRVKTLKKLIPNTESRGLDGLFRETADYILSLQMKVKVMQVMVKVLSGSEEGLIHL